MLALEDVQTTLSCRSDKQQKTDVQARGGGDRWVCLWPESLSWYQAAHNPINCIS